MIQVGWADFKAFIVARSLSIQWLDANGNYYMHGFDGPFHLSCILFKSLNTDDVVDFEANFKTAGNKSPTSNVIVDSQPDPLPFAQPTYRTKRNAIPDVVTIAKNDVGTLAFALPMELYASGGMLIVENAEFGDYVTAEVHDTDSIIPSPYRAALCEAWPTVAEYVTKAYVPVSVPGTVTAGSVTKHEINTYPLNAKITAGLYLNLYYHAVDSGLDRRAVVNYFLAKKL